MKEEILNHNFDGPKNFELNKLYMDINFEKYLVVITFTQFKY